MQANKNEIFSGRLKLFLLDPSGRVIGREGTKLDEDSDFLFIVNEQGAKEAIPKRLIIRYLEVV